MRWRDGVMSPRSMAARTPQPGSWRRPVKRDGPAGQPFMGLQGRRLQHQCRVGGGGLFQIARQAHRIGAQGLDGGHKPGVQRHALRGGNIQA